MGESNPHKYEETRPTLLQRIRDLADDEAWREFHRLYAPLLYRYARARGLAHEDAEEVRDRCLEVITRKIGAFEYDKQKGGFKNWLRRMTENKVIDYLRKRRERLADSQEVRGVLDGQPSPAELWETHWQREHLKRCVRQVKCMVPERDYQVFCMLLFEEATVEEVRARFGLNNNQVYKAKSRVLRCARQRLGKLEI